MSERITNAGNMVFVRKNDKIFSLFYIDNRLVQADVFQPEHEILDNIYVGKVKNVAANLEAAFVEYQSGKLCFLPMKECHAPILINRKSDGRLIAGDEIILQIKKDALKTKEPGATADLSFSGKYLVLTMGKLHRGFSTKLSQEEKENLKEKIEESEILKRITKKYGMVIRTNAREINSFSLLEEEAELLYQRAEEILKYGIHRTCFSILYQAPKGYLQTIQDTYSSSLQKILTDDAVLYHEILEYVQKFQPEDIAKVELYQDTRVSLNSLYNIESRLSEALAKRVWLKSGGYLIIEPTEALISIDVNSGKFVEKKKAEEMSLKINLEAAEEIGFQLKLRNLSGMILVDFISMEKEENQRKLFYTFKEICKKDSIRTDVIDVTRLGLIEVTRKKIKKSLWEQINA